MTEPTGPFVPRSKIVWSLGNPDAPDLSFNGVDGYGVEWIISDPQGWYASPPTELGLETRPTDGSWFGRGAYRARVLEIEGAFRVGCGGTDAVEETVERLQRALDPRRTTLLSVTEKVPKYVSVRPSSEVDAHPLRGHPRTRRFSFVLTAADPFKYAAGAQGLVSVPFYLANDQAMPGLTHPVTHPLSHGGIPAEGLGGQTTVDYVGNEPGFPLLTIDGPVSGPRLTNMTTGERIGLDVALSTGQQAVIDTELRTIRIGGIGRARTREAGSTFWQLMPGPNDLRFTADTYHPDALARVTFRPRWK